MNTAPVFNMLVDTDTLQCLQVGAEVCFASQAMRNVAGKGKLEGAICRGMVRVTDSNGTLLILWPSDIGAEWMTDDEYVKALVADGASEEVAEDIAAEAVSMLTRSPY